MSIVIPLAPNMGPVGIELKDRMDLYISRSWYSEAHLNAALKYFNNDRNNECFFKSSEETSEKMEPAALILPICLSSTLLFIAFLKFHSREKKTHGIKTKHEEFVSLLESDEVEEVELNIALKSRAQKLVLVQSVDTGTLFKALKHCMIPLEFSKWISSTSMLVDQRKAVLEKIESDVDLFEEVVLFLESFDLCSKSLNGDAGVKLTTCESVYGENIDTRVTSKSFVHESDDKGDKKVTNVHPRFSLLELSG